MGRDRSNRPALITSAPESADAELKRRERRYAWSAVVFIGSFTAAALLYRETVLALVLCAVAIVTLIAAVIGANIRTPSRRPGDLHLLGPTGTRRQPRRLPGRSAGRSD